MRSRSSCSSNAGFIPAGWSFTFTYIPASVDVEGASKRGRNTRPGNEVPVLLLLPAMQAKHWASVPAPAQLCVQHFNAALFKNNATNTSAHWTNCQNAVTTFHAANVALPVPSNCCGNGHGIRTLTHNVACLRPIHAPITAGTPHAHVGIDAPHCAMALASIVHVMAVACQRALVAAAALLCSYITKRWVLARLMRLLFRCSLSLLRMTCLQACVACCITHVVATMRMGQHSKLHVIGHHARSQRASPLGGNFHHYV